jgi:cytochrome c peroxidase
MDHLLGAQAFTPVINRVEMAGSFQGDAHEMRTAVVDRVSAIEEYRRAFGDVFDDVATGQPLRFEHIGAALAEFQFTLIRADAPIDAYARGDRDALTVEQKRGALLFFHIESRCGECHNTHDFANEMFSDFEPHVLGVPQVMPTVTISTFDGPGADEDYGLEQQTGSERDRYKFRTSPLRNAVYQPSFMHNGAFLCLEDAIRHHVDPYESARNYTADRLEPSLQGPLGPIEPVLQRLHGFFENPRGFSEEEIGLLVAFVGEALTDPDASPEALRSLVPLSVPSGLPVHDFEFDLPSADARCR